METNPWRANTGTVPKGINNGTVLEVRYQNGAEGMCAGWAHPIYWEIRKSPAHWSNITYWRFAK